MVLLSFDIEEFDMPLEYNGIIPFEEQLQVSRNGLQNILAILKSMEQKQPSFLQLYLQITIKILYKSCLLMVMSSHLIPGFIHSFQSKT